MKKMDQQSSLKIRDYSLDKLRGIAVITMVIFHAAYDLNAFKVLEQDFSQGFWYWFPRGIAGTFLFCVGMSLQKAYRKGVNWKLFMPRFIKVSLGALVISISTYLTFPSHWVYFGTLHCIALSSLLGLVFVNQKWLSFITSLALIVFMYSTGLNIDAITTLINQPSMDFIPIYPWFSVVLLGISYELFKIQFFKIILGKAPHFLVPIGQKSFWIYMIHQPVLYALSYLLYMALR